MESDEFKGLIEEVRKLWEETSSKLEEINKRLANIESSMEGEVPDAQALELLAEARKLSAELRELKHRFKARIRELLVQRASLLGSGSPFYSDVKEYMEDIADELEERVEEVEDRLDTLIEDIKEAIRDRRSRRGFPVVAISGPGGPTVIRGSMRALEKALEEVDRIIKETLSGPWLRTPSTIISSVRLPQADLNVIDLLVEAGIFKSRNEGIAFFVHKGIEASRDWLERIRGKLDEIKRLQEEARRELESIMGEQRVGDGDGRK